MKFVGSNASFEVTMDAKRPAGQESALTPKELVAAGLCGCTAMDVVGLLRKKKAAVRAFDVEAAVSMTEGRHPIVFSAVTLTFRLEGDVEAAALLEAVHLSQSKYCGVSAMLSKAVPIHYEVVLNGSTIGVGEANFEEGA
jgi:putative redox protein